MSSKFENEKLKPGEALARVMLTLDQSDRPLFLQQIEAKYRAASDLEILRDQGVRGQQGPLVANLDDRRRPTSRRQCGHKRAKAGIRPAGWPQGAAQTGSVTGAYGALKMPDHPPETILEELEVVLKTFPEGERLLVLAQSEQAMRLRGDLARLRAIKEYRRTPLTPQQPRRSSPRFSNPPS